MRVMMIVSMWWRKNGDCKCRCEGVGVLNKMRSGRRTLVNPEGNGGKGGYVGGERAGDRHWKVHEAPTPTSAGDGWL